MSDFFPNVFIAGASGSGKSTSLRNLNPERTAIINTERKVLPFRQAKSFTKQVNVESTAKFDFVLNKALDNQDVDVIVIDSFTSLTEIVYQEKVRNIEKVGDNVMAAWASYKDTLHDILLRSKAADKFVIFIGIDDQVSDEIGRMIKTVAVQGQLKGKVEKEFEIVLWTKVLDTEEQDDKYKFITNSDGSNKAKTPMGMFDQQLIDNDLSKVLTVAHSYFNDLHEAVA